MSAVFRAAIFVLALTGVGTWLEAAPSAWPAFASAVVAVDGSGQFRSLQAAIAAAPTASRARPWIIHVKPGVYRERLYVQREKRFLVLAGEDAERTIVQYDLHAALPGPDGKPVGTFRTPTAQIDADDFTAENLTFENSAGPVGQALAIRVDGDRAAFRKCRFVGWQDTILVNRGRHYFEDCFISGHVDFIFGGATAFFERCTIVARRDGYLTAASTPQEQAHGLVFHGGSIRGETPEVRTYLGRPWRSYASTVFLDTEMGDAVRPEGWHNWTRPDREKTVRYAEHASRGPGGAMATRVPWARRLSAEDAAALTARQVLAGADGWDPQAEGSAIEAAAKRAGPPEEGPAACPAPARYTADVSYSAAGGEPLRLDLCVPSAKGPLPAALLVHGGGWMAGDRKQAARALAPSLLGAGVAWIAVQYRLAPAHRHPAAVEDLEQAIRWTKARAASHGLDPARLALIGESAGGHLVAASAVRAQEDTAVAAVVPFFAPVDLVADSERRGGLSASLRALFGRADFDAEARTALREASPLAHLRPGLPPFLLVHGSADMSVPLEQSQRLLAALRAIGVDSELITIPDGTHGTRGWDALLPGWRERVTSWLVEKLRAAGRPAARRARGPRTLQITLAGDSTVTDDAGWGGGFRAHVARPARLTNLAKGGRSSKSYRDEGLWQAVLSTHPDYVLVQFGHNDQPGKGPNRETDPATSFRDNLGRYVDEARAAGAKPVLVTSLTRRLFGDDGRVHSNLGAYAEATQAVATAKGVPLLDLHKRSIELLDALGPHAAARLDQAKPDGSFDRTHLDAEGGGLFGGLVAQELLRVAPELAGVVSSAPLPETQRAAAGPAAERPEASRAAGAAAGARPPEAAPWLADRGDGTYRNPILFLDLSDPDAIRVGDSYYLVASTFSHVPGLTLLESKDLVSWRYLPAALPRLAPASAFARPSRGNGVWAPAIRHRGGRFWIYFPDPDRGIFAISAEDARGPWTSPALVKAGSGLIDPCPFWDDDGSGWLVHAWARSRAGFANALTLQRLSDDGLRVVGEGRTLIDGNLLAGYTTLEGPKLYKRNGYYYVFAPAGGVKEGWQSVFRSRAISGPYEGRIVLDQGRSEVNGPHQGAWVLTPSGEDWFLHFQDRGAFGRVVHLQPMRWADDWPLIGYDHDGDGRGEPVATHAKPGPAARVTPASLAASDEFEGPGLGPQWQWEANPREGSFRLADGVLRLFSQRTDPGDRLWPLATVVGQRLPGPAAVATTELRFAPQAEGERAGLVVLGLDYSWIGLRRTAKGVAVTRVLCRNAAQDGKEETLAEVAVSAEAALLRVEVDEQARCRFSYSVGGSAFTPLGPEFQAVPGRWVGARLGLFAAAAPDAAAAGSADFAWLRLTAR